MLRALWTLIDRELRAQLRDSTVLIYSVLMPLLFMPGTIWLGLQVMIYQDSLAAQDPPRVAFIGDPVELGGLLDPPVQRVEVEAPLDALRAGELELVVEAEAEREALTLTLHQLSVRPRSVVAEDLVADRVGALRLARREALAERRGLAPEALGRWAIRAEDIDEAGNLLRDLLAKGITPLLLMLLSINAFYPSMELVVGERESGCLETSLIAAPGRLTLLLGKLLAVMLLAALPVLGGALSVTLTLASLIVQLSAGDGAGALARLAELELGLSAGTLALAAGLLFSVVPLFIGVYVLCAIPARTLKEAQSLGSFIMLTVFAPVGYALTEPELTAGLAFVPVLNALLTAQALLSEEAVAAWMIAAAPALNLGLAALALLAGARLMRSERYLLGQWLPPRVQALLLRLGATR